MSLTLMFLQKFKLVFKKIYLFFFFFGKKIDLRLENCINFKKTTFLNN